MLRTLAASVLALGVATPALSAQTIAHSVNGFDVKNNFTLTSTSGKTIRFANVRASDLSLPGPRGANRRLCKASSGGASIGNIDLFLKATELLVDLTNIYIRLDGTNGNGSLTAKEKKVVRKTPRCGQYVEILASIESALTGRSFGGASIDRVRFVGGRSSRRSKGKATVIIGKEEVDFKGAVTVSRDKDVTGLTGVTLKSRDGKVLTFEIKSIHSDYTPNEHSYEESCTRTRSVRVCDGHRVRHRRGHDRGDCYWDYVTLYGTRTVDVTSSLDNTVYTGTIRQSGRVVASFDFTQFDGDDSRYEGSCYINDYRNLDDYYYD